jgi:hypothetical protein
MPEDWLLPWKELPAALLLLSLLLLLHSFGAFKVALLLLLLL